MVHIVKNKLKYQVADRYCLGKKCLHLGPYQHRGASQSGSKDSGVPDSLRCLYQAYYGCPKDFPYDPNLVKIRKKDGLRVIVV